MTHLCPSTDKRSHLHNRPIQWIPGIPQKVIYCFYMRNRDKNVIQAPYNFLLV
ncbi:hypothetical protein SAMN02746041_02840 [Desulfacinum hydrothermale DSM 13146]|uniref:Uncharacterized protein n=1 Tax=Desulfacinum hydrothermale DSM 13146 TaxID=1121390 RepID=A0A1W1XT35_9BACT|nr:hypothetical protein SAMN02746041_02840 [Desulfacinum hydrothermale DSM 13146]